MKTRTDLLNYLAERYNLQRYLEIGVQNPAQNFEKINCNYKVSVDPDPNAKADFVMSSDDFFSDGFGRLFVNNSWETRFDLIFIDGLHTAEQVKKDFENSLKVLSPNGFIVLHDCNPEKEEHTIVPRPKERGHWNGDVYRFAIGINKEYAYTVDIDNGCLVFSRIFGRPFDTITIHYATDTDWSYFDNCRKKLLNLISWEEFVKL